MATKKMFSCEIIGSDAFYDLSHNAQLAYFYLGMSADNYGFVGGPKRILRMAGLLVDALEELEKSGFVLVFEESGVLVITHWWQNNNLSHAQLAKTIYMNEYSQLTKDSAGVYCFKPQDSLSNAQDSPTENSIIEEDKTEDNLSICPSLDQVKTYVTEIGHPDFDVQYFYNYYSSRNWLTSRGPMKDWHAVVRTCIYNENAKNQRKRRQIPLESMTLTRPQHKVQVRAQTRICQFCGKNLEPIHITLGGQRFTVAYYDCACEENQKVIAMQEEAAKAQKVKEQQEQRRRTIVNSGICARYHDAVSSQTAELVSEVKNGKNLFITGSVGTGKTYLASAMSIALIDQGVRVKFVSMIINKLDEGKASFCKDDDPLFKYQEVPVLVLDDLGYECPTDVALERMSSLVDRRYANMLPTVVVTSYMPSQLIRRLARKGNSDIAAAIVDRLCQNSRAILLSGPDRRLENRSLKTLSK